jgi:uncharacterized membrane protein
MTMWLDGALALAALMVAALLRPWRAVAGGPPWPWLAWVTLMPLMWTADRLIAMPVAQPLSGACLLVLMAGWPLAMLALPWVALLAAWGAGLAAPEALHRAVWLGVAPGTLALGVGLGLRRWLPRQPFVYILGRGFIATVVCTMATGAASIALRAAPPGLGLDDLLLGRCLAAWNDGWLCGLLTAIFVAYRPQWLATYADRLYLPPPR